MATALRKSRGGGFSRRDEVAAAIVGASRPEQVKANAEASGIALGSDLLTAIDDALADAPLRGQTVTDGASEGITYRDWLTSRPRGAA
jgi:hypothetical protein